MAETAYDYVTVDNYASMFSSERKWVGKLKRLAEEHPDLVEIKQENKDGSVLVHLPINWLKVSPPRTLNLTDAQKQASSERLKALNLARNIELSR